ncbi:MAG: hypothetical protein K2K02_07920 [Ruminococcus sp.]|nr:hypothetical protein [Ruminococcus sp.]
MDNGTEIYKKLIDELVEMSRSCVDADKIRNRETCSKLKNILLKLTPEDRDILADYVLKAYCDGIFNVLDLLEWYACCRNMKITIDGENVPTDKFEGMQNDFIGRRDGWEFPEKEVKI